MSLDKNFISLDLEMNKPSGKIIQVGICVANFNGGYEPLLKKWYIDPNEDVTEYITQLTGITNDDIKTHSVTHQQMATELSDIIKGYDCYTNPVTWGGGDYELLLSEIKQHTGEKFIDFGRRYIDVKTIFTFMEMCKGNMKKAALKSALGRRKMQFIGEAHRADVDAHNTIRLFFDLIKSQSSMVSCINALSSINI